MREILFRGKDVRTGYWKEGSLVREWLGVDIGYTIRDVPDRFNQIAFRSIVDPKTVGQFTGLTDKNGKKIFEGDIVEYPIKSGGHKGENIHEVVFENRHGTAYFGIKMSDIETWGFDMEVPSKLMKVIGNIHDNPELLEDDK